MSGNVKIHNALVRRKATASIFLGWDSRHQNNVSLKTARVKCLDPTVPHNYKFKTNYCCEVNCSACQIRHVNVRYINDIINECKMKHATNKNWIFQFEIYSYFPRLHRHCRSCLWQTVRNVWSTALSVIIVVRTLTNCAKNCWLVVSTNALNSISRAILQ